MREVAGAKEANKTKHDEYRYLFVLARQLIDEALVARSKLDEEVIAARKSLSRRNAVTISVGEWMHRTMPVNP